MHTEKPFIAFISKQKKCQSFALNDAGSVERCSVRLYSLLFIESLILIEQDTFGA